MDHLLVSASNVVLLLAGAAAFGIAGIWLPRRLRRSASQAVVKAVVLAVTALALTGVAAEITADIMPDLNTELPRPDRDPLRALNRLALYRMLRESIVALRGPAGSGSWLETCRWNESNKTPNSPNRRR